jgi:hypothetical protein
MPAGADILTSEIPLLVDYRFYNYSNRALYVSTYGTIHFVRPGVDFSCNAVSYRIPRLTRLWISRVPLFYSSPKIWVSIYPPLE